MSPAARPEVLGVIPARAGSKGVPRKNVRPVGGRPLIEWTWAAARAARSVTRLIVTTDDPEVVSLARAAGVAVPFLRPAELASDSALAIDVVEHALAWLEREERYAPDLVLWLQPTSPLRTAADIDAATALQAEKSADSVVSVCATHAHPAWLQTVGPDGLLAPWLGDAAAPTRRQELPPVYELNGAIYLTRRSVLLAERTFRPKRTFAYVMDRERSVDIDTPWDLRVADLVLRDGR